MKPRLTKPAQAGLSLIGVALFAMAVAALAMLGLFYFRYQSLPWQDNWAYWLKRQAAQATANSPSQPAANTNLRPAANFKEGIKRCQIDGKVVYSDTLCQSQTPSVQLHDNVTPAVRASASQNKPVSAKQGLHPD